ncbi:hypothetical protein [Haloarchaeobius amylolyticus]|uniref:hypothetical protein n=1 Tax=Haloarchaeobius amylolyticus TaxID=1198296 RepID=UPI00226F9E64|nr:hypothetical protein [Haloarchaeobius amylolyticus]
MIHEHVGHLHHVIDDQSLPARLGITLGALVALPLLGTGARTLGSALDLGWLTLPLLAIAHVPAVIVLLGVWSIGCDVCRPG